MPITIQCPNPACGTTAVVADTVAGRGVRCKRCGTPFVARQTIDGQKSDTRPAGTGADPFPVLPAEFGRYRVLRLLGRGGMGSVYLAEDTQLGRQVALKLPAIAPGESGQRAERFVREARSAAVLQHSSICTVYDAGEVGGRPFISMALVEGKSLDDLIDPDAPLPDRRVVEIVRKVALALAHAHAKGVVHRDLKPANVMLTPDGEPVVMDFGLAKRVADTDVNEAKLTRDGAVLGTPAYMAPEQVRGEIDRIGPAVDVYALGVLLFEMLTGRPPYAGPIGVVLGRILHAEVPSASEFRHGLDPRLVGVCRRAMAKDPAHRFPSMTAFADALAASLDASAVSVVAVPMPLPLPPPPAPVRPAVAPAASVPDFATLTDERAPAAHLRKRKPEPPAWKGWVLAGAAVAALLAAAAGVWLTVRTKHGDVVIELGDPRANVEVRVDGERITLAGPDRPVSLTAGEHGLIVTGPDFETVTESFTVKRGDRKVVTVTLKPKPKAAAVRDRPTAGPEAKGGTDPTPVQPPVSAPVVGADGWVSLFNGKDLTGWADADGTAPVGWVVLDGAIHHPAVNTAVAKGRDLWTRDRYGDFVLEAEYRTGGNSGIFLRADRTADRFAEALEVQIDKPAAEPTRWTTGALVSVLAPSRDASRANDWNAVRVTARGSRVEVTLNGQDVLNIDLDQWAVRGKNPDGTANSLTTALRDLKREGHIGLQALDGSVSFRNLRIKPLAGRAAATPPPPDAVRLGTSAYKVYPLTRSWKEAKALCEGFGGRLAVIKSAEQNKFVTGLMNAAGLAEAWIGATDEVEEGKWVWVDGTPMGYSNWDVGQPNNKGNVEHYLLLWVGRTGQYRESGKWADQPDTSTDHKPGFVCEWVAPAGAAAPPAAVAPAAAFVPMFNGKDLSGWTAWGTNKWEWTGGSVAAFGDANGYLLSAEEYQDFELELEYRLGIGSASGVFLRAWLGGAVTGAGFLEVQLLDDSHPRYAGLRPESRTGAVYGVFPPSPVPTTKRDGWNTLWVRLVGRKIRVSVNGSPVLDADLDTAKGEFERVPGLARATGRIGLQKQAAGSVEFRNVRVRDVSPK